MHRQNLLFLLEEYQQSIYYHDQELPLFNQLYNFVQEHPNCFERSLEKGHLTASAIVWNRDKNAFLLMHHKKLNKWLQPGGHADGETDLLQVAIKEVQEESGLTCIKPLHKSILDIDIHFIPSFKGIPSHYHYDIRFLLMNTQHESLQHNLESFAIAWVKPNKVLEFTHEASLLKALNKAQYEK